MKAKSVPSSWLERDGRRLDCNPYMSGALEAKVLLESMRARKDRLQTLTLDGIDGIINPGRIKRLWVSDDAHGVRFLSSTDILQADLSNLQIIGREAVRANRKLLLRAHSTLVTRAGTVGRMAYARPDMHELACTEDVLRVVPDAARVPPGYLHAYLRSKFGVPLIVSGTYGAIIQHIEPSHIADLPVPRLGKAVEGRAHELVEESAKLLAKFQSGVNSATKQLFESVGLEDISAADWHLMGRDLGFSVSTPPVDSLRALNFTPRFQRLVKAVKAVPHKALGDLVVPDTLQRGARFKRIDAAPEFSYQLVGQRELFWVKPEGRWIAKSAAGKDVLVKPGTILVAARGTLGESEMYCRGEFIWGPATKFAYSEDLLRVIADSERMPTGCLYAFTRSETAFRMLRSISTGTKLQDHHRVMLATLPVPTPTVKEQWDIHQLVVEAYDARHKAVALVDQAIALVEDAIEKGATN
jgi:hypothetical protein